MKLKLTVTLFYLLAIVVFAVFPFSAAGMQDVTGIYVVNFRLDHLLHLLAFIPLYPLAQWIVRPSDLSRMVLLLLVCLLVGMLAEGVQYFLMYRSFNPADLLSNGAGVLVGFILSKVLVSYE